MNRSFRCQTCDKRRTSLNVSLYTSRLTGLGQDRILIEKVHVFNLHQMYVHAKFRHFVRSHSTLHEAIRNISFSFLKKILIHSWWNLPSQHLAATLCYSWVGKGTERQKTAKHYDSYQYSGLATIVHYEFTFSIIPGLRARRKARRRFHYQFSFSILSAQSLAYSWWVPIRILRLALQKGNTHSALPRRR